MSESTEAAITDALVAYGYSEAQIAAMSPAQISAEYQNAVAAGVVPDAARNYVDWFKQNAQPSPAGAAPLGKGASAASASRKGEKPKAIAPGRGRQWVFGVVLVLGAGLYAYSRLTDGDQEPATPTCSDQWESRVFFDPSAPEIAIARLRGGNRPCAELTFSCSAAGPSFVIALDREIAEIGTMRLDLVGKKQIEFGPLKKVTDRRRVTVAAHAIADAFSLEINPLFQDGTRRMITLTSTGAAEAINPVLVACGLRRIPTQSVDDPPDYDDDNYR